MGPAMNDDVSRSGNGNRLADAKTSSAHCSASGPRLCPRRKLRRPPTSSGLAGLLCGYDRDLGLRVPAQLRIVPPCELLIGLQGLIDKAHHCLPFEHPHMGSFGSRGEIHSCKVKLRRQFRYPRSEPVCMTRLVSEHDQPHIRSPLETAAPRSRLRRAGAQGGETILWIGFFRPWLLSVRPPGSARTDQVLEDLIIC